MSERISAGDVDRFGYCPLNWKRAQEGDRGAGGKAGIRHHAERSKAVDTVGSYQRQAFFSLQTAFFLALVAISAATLALELIVLQTDTFLDWVLVLMAVMWVAGSLYLVVFHLYFHDRAESLGRAARVVDGEVEYVDTERQRPDVLVSKLLPLEGRPDYVVERDGVQVPVEVKSGKAPRRPYDSHVLQLAAYCHLVEQSSGSRPPLGVIEYADQRFEVPYTDEVETALVKTLLRIQLAERTGEAHRDHRSRGRCAGCARREGCPERLDVKPAAAPASAAAEPVRAGE